MTKLFLLFFLFLVSLSARENPFFPATGEADITITSNADTSLDPLKRATISLPSTARVLQSVTLKYKNLDGSISEKTEVLGQSVDWHLPIFVSQNYGGVSSEPKKSLKVKEKYVKIAGLKFIKLYKAKHSLKILTKDAMLRNFLLTKPNRIVCDFKRDIDIRSYEKDVGGKSIVTKVKLGNHKGYYRVVIELDGYYRYNTKPIKNGYQFNFL